MKMKIFRISFRVCVIATLSLFAIGGTLGWAQTGAYTLNGGTANLPSLTETTSVSNQSGIFVYSSGSLTVGKVTISTSGNSTNTTISDQYGGNAGILAGSASTKGTITITGSSNSVVTTGNVANGLLATYTGSSVTMLGGSITCSGANAHGVDVTYGGSVTISNVTVVSSNDNSSAVATDYGGGYVTVYGGSVRAADTNATGHSAGVYSTGIITVENSTVASVTDCGGVIDGANSIILTNTSMIGSAEGMKLWKTAPATGPATVIVNGGSLTVSNGDGFYITGTAGNAAWGTVTVLGGATISASSGNIVNTDSGSLANFTASGETLSGNFIADSTSTNLIALQNSTTLTGCINTAALLTIDATSIWNTISNSVITTLTNSGTINLTGKITTANVLVKSGGIFGGSGTVSSNLTVNTGATLVLNPTTNFIVGGKVIFGGAVTIAPSTTNISAGTYKLLTCSNSLSGTPTFTYSAPGGSGQTAVFNTATSGVISVTISAPPSAPTNLTATAGDAKVTLNWNTVTNATSYNVKRSLVSGGGYTFAGNSTATNFLNTSVTDGTLYFYVVTATNSSGESAISNEVSARPVSSVSTNLTFTASNGTLHISWPADHIGWHLQAQTNSLAVGLGTNWATVTSADATNQLLIPIVPTNGSVFFRLQNP